MATLEKIRNRAGWLISLVLGLALLAFILGDFLRKSTYGKAGSDVIGEILGQDIKYRDYMNELNKLTENYKMNTGKTGLDENESEMLRKQAWDDLVSKIVFGKEFDELGLKVSDDELYDMVAGQNISPQIKNAQIFKNPKTGMFDRNLVIRYLKYIDNDAPEKDKRMWIAFEDELQKNRLIEKYYNLIAVAFNLTKTELKARIDEAFKDVDAEFVVDKYSNIPDSTVTLTDDDYLAYYNENKYQYKQDASRSIEYVSFDVVPSKEDTAKLMEELQSLKEEFKTTKDDINYVNLNSEEPYQDINYKPGELEPQIDSLMFSADSGFVYGPYYAQGKYKIAKLIAIKMMPDSVRASHILLQPKDQNDYVRVKNLADSLKQLIDNGADFAELAKTYSQDKGSAIDGGDLKWFTEGKMVKPFEKFCFEGKKGDVGIVNSQFGVHIIKITDQSEYKKRVNVGFIVRELIPSQQTIQYYYSKAGTFAMENNTKEKFDSYLADHSEITKKIASNLKPEDTKIPGLDNPRELIRWVYKAELGDVSQPFELNNKFVVACLTEIKEKGYAPLEDIKDEITKFVMNDKKAKILTKELNSEKIDNLDKLAEKVKTTKEKVAALNFNKFSLPLVGFEPDVIAVTTSLEKDKISKPIKGRAGVYVVRVYNEYRDNAENDEMLKQRLYSAFKNRVSYQVFDALKENANIVDNRIKFF